MVVTARIKPRCKTPLLTAGPGVAVVTPTVAAGRYWASGSANAETMNLTFPTSGNAARAELFCRVDCGRESESWTA
jgi:hypothetical protein